MKKVLFFALFLMILGAASVRAQVRIGGNTAPEKGAVLDLKSAYVGGLLLPQVELTSLTAIPSGWIGNPSGAADGQKLKGLLVYNQVETVTPKGIYVWDGTAWKKLV